MKKNLLIGFTGSVASLLAPKICKTFLKKYNVKVVLTEASRQFVNENELVNGLGNIGLEIFSDKEEFFTPLILCNNGEGPNNGKQYKKGDPILHIELRDWADCFLIAPCSANTLAKIANGYCDNLLTSIVRAWDLNNEWTFNRKIKPPAKKIIIAPAMNTKMWEHPITKEHASKLKDWGILIIDPVEKKLACGETGIGAMADINDIASLV